MNLSSNKKDINLNNIKLIFAIGNPEKIYEDTRHNIGTIVTKEILKKLKINLTYKKKFNSYTAYYTNKKNKLTIIAISNEYMNNSGDALIKIVKYHKFKTEEILVVQDDMNLSFLETSFKFNSSSHGHNGIKDILKKLNTNKFYKLKIGIGKPKFKENNISYVLNSFSKEEKKKILQKSDTIFLMLKNFNMLS